jgi:molecular chaperone HtpG
MTTERDLMLANIYRMYFKHISQELESLKKNFSMTWAAREANWLLNQLDRTRYGGREAKPEDQAIFEKSLMMLDCVLIERMEERSLTSINGLMELSQFWTIDCESYSSADSLVKEAKSGNTSALKVISSIYDTTANIGHLETVLCKKHMDNMIQTIIRDKFEVEEIMLIPDQRRIDLKWIKATPEKEIWKSIYLSNDSAYNEGTRCYIQNEDIKIENLDNNIAILSDNLLFILNNSQIHTVIIKFIDKTDLSNSEDILVLVKFLSIIASILQYKNADIKVLHEIIDTNMDKTRNRGFQAALWEKVTKEELINAVLETKLKVFDTSIWNRRFF